MRLGQRTKVFVVCLGIGMEHQAQAHNISRYSRAGGSLQTGRRYVQRLQGACMWFLYRVLRRFASQELSVCVELCCNVSWPHLKMEGNFLCLEDCGEPRKSL